jgi:hypothetical protein
MFKPGDLVRIIKGRYKGRTGTYMCALSCGQFHGIDLGNGLVTLAPRAWFEKVEVNVN